jgi:L-lactate utilization protein LutC
MKAKTFENLIRKVVREEIDYALRREIKTLKEDLSKELKPVITEHKERIVEVPNNPMSEVVKNNLREKIMGSNPITKQHFSQDSTINALLNETAQGDTNLDSGNSPVSLSQPFSSASPLPMDTAGMPTEVADAVTRDYSGLMQAIDKKKGK